MRFLGFDESNNAVFCRMNGEIARHVGSWASKFRGTSLTNKNFAVFNFLATKALDAEALASIIMDVFGGTASFYV